MSIYRHIGKKRVFSGPDKIVRRIAIKSRKSSISKNCRKFENLREGTQKIRKNPEKIRIFGPPVPRPSCRQRARLAEIHISQKGSAPRFSGIFGIFSRLIQAIFPPIPALISTGLRKIDKIGGRASPRSGSDDFRTIPIIESFVSSIDCECPLTVNHRYCDANIDTLAS